MLELHRSALAAAISPDWLVGQRWMRTKHLRPVAVELDDLVPLREAECWLAVVGVRYRDAATERYAVPLVMDGGAAREPLAGDGMWRALARLTIEGGVLAGRTGLVRGTPAAGEPDRAPLEVAGGQLAERMLGLEQSNTSVVLGDRHVLKLYRLLETGTNPEVEVATFLTEAGFAQTPAVLGSATYVGAVGRESALAMTQAFVENDGDAWSWILRRLGAPDGFNATIAAAAAIGRLTAALHAALASRPEHPDFPARDATPEERAAWRRAAEDLLHRALAVLGPADRARLEVMAAAISRRLAALDDPALGPTRASRIHGDYHLGQLLVAATGFVVIDFEGEPARPLADRRLPASPLRDVAGMLRSFDYAARTAEREGYLDGRGAGAWLEGARDAFLDAYGRPAAGDGELLLALELEKACYEVLYEATSRPSWTWLPLGALERLVR